MKKNEIFFSENKYTCILFADRYPRIQGIQQVQAWNDQQVLVFDCLSRLSTYKYIGLYDKDEYIVPELKTPLQGSLKSFVVSNKYCCHTAI